MPTPPESEPSTTPEPAPNAAEALRARLRAMATAEQSKREAAPAPAKPDDALGSSGLWDAPKPQVEEPISPFLIPIDEEPLRPHERVQVEPVRPAALPKARVVAMPAPTDEPKEEDERVSLEAHVETVLTLLRTNELDEAIAKQDTPTLDAPSAVVRTRWQLTKELVGVAKSLPPRVVQVIATAIGRDNLEGAKGELTLFRQQNAAAAKEADVVLRTRAKSIQRGVAGALYVEPPVYTPPAQFTPTPSYESPRSSGANLWWIGVVVVLGIIRIAVRTSSHSSYDYSYQPSYSSSYEDYQRTAALMEAMEKNRQEAAAAVPAIVPASPYEEPAEFYRDASQEQLVDEIERSLFVMRENDWLSDQQSEKMTSFWVTSPFYTECTEARSTLKAFEKEKMLKGDDMALAKRHVKAVRTRVDTLCPATKKAAKKKAKPVEKMELTDTPPTVEAN